jgi:peptide/nickel transport system permease protein
MEVINQDYVRTARSKGLGERTVVMRHVLRNALLPVVTVLGVELGLLIAGAVIVEAVFAWQGFGTLVLTAATNHDYPVLQAAGFLVGLTVSIAAIVVDLAYGIVDPRIRAG